LFMSDFPELFHRFSRSVSEIELPENFTFPFYYDPHPIALKAVEQLQSFLKEHSLDHNFGLKKEDANDLEIGKMFGVLVVQTKRGELGFLCAFSGKLQSGNDSDVFVPPVYDMLKKDGFFLSEEAEISAINRAIEEMENEPAFISLQQQAVELDHTANADIGAIKSEIKRNKMRRKEQRQDLNEKQHDTELEELRKESIREQYFLKDRTNYWNERKAELSEKIEAFRNRINELKAERKKRSSALQRRLFDAYRFLNSRGEQKSLGAIFSITEENRPPAGAGECCAPKLLHYAYRNQLKPIALAEFWWGISPSTEIRKHGHFYPACRGKCEPILGHMLEGLSLDPNPLITSIGPKEDLEIIYEDEYMLAVNKPAELLSVPGINIHDSVLTRIKNRYPDANGPMIVHRLDMGTSGILLLAKDALTYKVLQRQFMTRKVRKKYIALLDGIPELREGTIDLPIRVDLDDRPRQMVCYDHGKKATTEFKVVGVNNGRAKIEFYPITGRTHQLRVHAAHSLGLNVPIVGDDLYGRKDERLFLHASEIEFRHPTSKENIHIKCLPYFDINPWKSQ